MSSCDPPPDRCARIEALIPEARLRHPIAFCEGEWIRAERLLSEAAALADGLPDRAHVVNLCVNRYRFLLTLVAAMMRGHTSLLPPNRAPAGVRAVLEQYPDSYVASDEPPGLDGYPAVLIQRPKGGVGDAPNPVPTDHQTVAVVFTSGSTAQPEAHAKTWNIFRHSVDLIARHLGVAGSAGFTTVATVPAQHMYGLETTVLLPLRSRCVLTDHPAFYPADVQAALAAVPSPRLLVTTPIHLRACLGAGLSWPRVDLIVSATAPLSRELAVAAERRFGATLLEIYGFTEAGSVATRRTSQEDRFTLFSGLQLFSGQGLAHLSAPYFERPVPLQDLVESDGAGHFRWLGRSADQVNVAGKRTSLAALNATLLAIPGVTDGTFFLPGGASDPEPAAMRLVAFAVAPGLSVEGLLAALRERIDPAFLPRPLFLVDQLPRQAHGKLPRAALSALAEACAARRNGPVSTSRR